MRKLFSLIAAVLFAGSMMATTYSMTPDNETTGNASTSYVTTLTEFTHAGISWKMTQWNPNTLQVKTNQSSAESEFRFYNTSAFSGKITKVVVTFSALTLKSTSETGFMFVGGSEEVSATTGGVSGVWDADAKTLTWEPAETDNFTYFALYQNGKVATGTNKLATEDAIVVTYEGGAAPAVEAPSIKGDTHFYDAVEVSLSCATEGAAIYYTLDGETPTAASALYANPFTITATTTVKAIAILGEDASAVAEKVFTKNPSFASFEALVAGEVADKTLIEVSFENLVITRFYENSGDNPQRKGIYFNVGEVEYEIYNSSAVVPEAWEVDGKVSGTIRGQWQHYVNTSKGIDIWEVVPMANGWAWTELTYVAPAAAGCDWDNIEFLGNGVPAMPEYTNRFKVCADPAPSEIVNIQSSFGTEPGIYVTFPGAAWGEISLPEDKYATQGAGMLLYVSAFLYDAETEVTIVNGEVTYTLTIFNANPEEAPAQLVAVSEETTWNFSKITANTANALYNKEGIQLTDESTPSKNDEVIYAEYTSDFMTLDAEFDGASMAFKGEYPIRKNKYCQAGTLHFKAAVAGSIVVKFSDTGTSASATAVKRYLVVNGEQTEYWTSRENNGETDPYAAQLEVVTEAIAVPAGDVTITGSSAIVVYYVTFTPSGTTAISNTAAEDKAEKIMRNGMILIVKGDKTYNVMGQIVK